MKYKVSICDGEAAACERVEKLLLGIFEKNNLKAEIDIFYSGEKYKQHLQRGNAYDFSIVDIELFEMSGIDVGKFIRDVRLDLRTQIIFISTRTAHAMELFSVQPLDFLIEPIAEEALERAVLRGIQYLGNQQEYYTYQTGQKLKSIPCGDILYFHSERRQIGIFAVQGEDWFYGRLADVRENLPGYFEQIHQSFIVNLNLIKECHYEELRLMDGSVIPISRPYRNTIRAKMQVRRKSGL